jgi:hypothetical protein
VVQAARLRFPRNKQTGRLLHASEGGHVKRMTWVVATSGLLILGSWSWGDGPKRDAVPPEVATGREVIRPEVLKLHLGFIASDELEGRATPSHGLDVAARYLATHMQFYGYQPAGDDGTYFQKMKIIRRKPSARSKINLQVKDKAVELAYGKDFVGSGQDSKGPVVFAGYAVASAKKEVGYDDLAGLDLKGKIALVFDGLPEGLDAAAFQSEQRFGDRTFRVGVSSFSKWAALQSRGAVGMITIMKPEFSKKSELAQSPFEREVARLDQPVEVFEFMDKPGGGGRGPFSRGARPTGVQITAKAADQIGQALGVDFTAIRAKIADSKKPVPTTIDATAALDFETDITETKWTQNVIARLEGSDPKLKDEYVAFSAHYDHVGVRSPSAASFGQVPPNPGQPPDSIYNGADDDGSGTCAILSIAEAFSRIPRTKRSLLFIWHAGEERGLIGSSYYTETPTIPLAKISALINIDMIGRNWKDKPENKDHCFLVGSAQTSKDLDDLIRRVCGTRLKLDEKDPENYFMRSDHYLYAMRGVPIAFFCTGTHKDYHRPSDHVESILFDKYEQVTEVAFEAGLELANGESRPKFTGKAP